MADTLGSMNMSMYGDRLRMWGMSNMVDTQSMVDVELAMLQMKNYPVESQKKYVAEERAYLVDFQTTMKNFQASVAKLKDISSASKGITYGQEGYASVSADKNALEGTYSLEVLNIASTHKIMGDAQTDPTTALGREGTILINNKELELTNDMSLNDLVKKINEGNFGINATSINGTMVLTGKKTGEANAIQLTDSPSGVLQGLGLLTSTGAIKNEVQAAKDANFKLDGVAVKSTTNSVSDVLTGVTIQLTKPTTSATSFTINKNDTMLKDAVSEFVNMYNSVMKRINQHTAKGAVLQGNSIVNQAKNDMSRSLTTATGSQLMLYEIGIQMDGIAKDGTIKFDEAKLLEQLENNYDNVESLLLGEKSFTNQLHGKMELLIKEEGSIATKLDGLDRTIKNLDDTLVRYEESFVRQRESILEKYARFEQSMGRLNSQETMMTALLESLAPKKA